MIPPQAFHWVELDGMAHAIRVMAQRSTLCGLAVTPDDPDHDPRRALMCDTCLEISDAHYRAEEERMARVIESN